MTAATAHRAAVSDPGALDRSAGPATLTADAPRRDSRVYYFDYLRVFATVGVVLIHSATQVFDVSGATPGASVLSHFTTSDSAEALGRFAVGCFFMVSGALLLDTRHRFRLPRQLLRVGVPLLVWSCIYLVINGWWADRGLPTTSGPGATDSTTSILKALLAGSVSAHFWFVYALIACYLALPLLRPLTALPETRQKRLLEYALGIWAVVFLVIPAIDHYAPHSVVAYPDLLPSLPSKYLGFVLLGYYLHRYGVRIRGWRPGRGTLIAAAVGAVVTISALTFLDQIIGGRSRWAQTNPTPQVVLYGSAVFLLAKAALDRPGKHFAFVSLFSKLSFRIYLCHYIVLFWLRSISPLKDFYKVQPELSIVVLGSLALAISFVIAYGIEQVAPIRRWV